MNDSWDFQILGNTHALKVTKTFILLLLKKKCNGWYLFMYVIIICMLYMYVIYVCVLCMYVFMYVFIFLCIYVMLCMYVCMLFITLCLCMYVCYICYICYIINIYLFSFFLCMY